MDESTPLCKTSGSDLSDYMARFSKTDGVFPDVVEQNSEKFAKSVEISKMIFGNSPYNRMQIDYADEHTSDSHGIVVNSFDGGLAGFAADSPRTMDMLRKFLETVSGFFVASITNPKESSKVLLMLDWSVKDARR